MEVIFAHRGASFEAPENTIPAFQLALEQGSKALELDVHLTLDQKLIVCHDDLIDRTTDGTGFIVDQTLAALKQRDAGSWFHESFAGAKLPTLQEVLELCDHTIMINIEIKNLPFFHIGIEDKVIQLIKRFGFKDNILISSFDHVALQTVQQLDPGVKLGVLLSNQLIRPWEYVKQTKLNAYSIHPYYTFVDETYIQECHDAGYKVYTYTVDDRKDYQYLTSIKVDGIFTNIPARFNTYTAP